METKFSIISNFRTYGIELRERNYPAFEGRYNAYVSCYGQLSGQYLGAIPEPVKMDIGEDQDATELIAAAEKLIMSGIYSPVIW